MKTNITKIIILFAALIVVVGGILLYEKTKVAPPTHVEKKDVYAEYLKQCQNGLLETLTDAQKDSVFNSIIVHITTFRKEGKIDDNIADYFLSQAAKSYVPGYYERCLSKFNPPIWYPKDHAEMLSRIETLERLKYYNNGNPIVIGADHDNLEEIKGIIKKYRLARALSKNTAYRGIKDAKEKIKKATEYANDEYLSNCSDLQEDLFAVRGKIADSHLRYARSMVNKLQFYKKYNKDDYYKLNKQVYQVLEDYRNCKGVYGTAYGTEEINNQYDKAKEYRKEADKYYEILY